MRIQGFGAKTDRGQRREHNEDAFLAQDGLRLFAVADGVGGRSAGEIASAIAMRTLSQAAPRLGEAARQAEQDGSSQSRLKLVGLLEEVVREAHQRIMDQAAQLDKVGMATTIVAAVFAGDRAYVAHVGDSRAYLLRDDQLHRLTEDHKLALLWAKQGRGTYEELLKHKNGGALYQALGVQGHMVVDTLEVPLAEADVLLLCSDGLYGPVDDPEIARMLQQDDLPAASGQLIDAANARGGPDNITVVAVRVGQVARPAATTRTLDEALSGVFLFRGLRSTERHLIGPYLEEIVVEPGAQVMVEGDEADMFYILGQGRMRISVGGTALRDLVDGAHVGELGLLPGNKRTATVTAVQKSVLYALSRDSFEEICRQRPELGVRLSMSLLETMASRLREMSRRLAIISRVTRGDLRGLVQDR